MPRARIGAIELHYEEAGEGTPLVLIHGLGNDLHLWDGIVPDLAKHHRVLRFDVRGFGLSDKPAGPYSAGLLAQDVAAFLDALQIDRAHLLGLSMGGVIAQRFALDHGRRVRSLVLVSTSSEVGEKSRAAWHRLADTIEQRGFDSRSADASRAFAPAFAVAHPEIVAAAGARNAANDPLAYAAAARASGDYHWTAELGTITAPVLIVQGLADQLTPPGGSVKMSRVLPHNKLVLLEGVGHNIQAEAPLQLAHLTVGFAAAVDLGGGPERQ